MTSLLVFASVVVLGSSLSVRPASLAPIISARTHSCELGQGLAEAAVAGEGAPSLPDQGALDKEDADGVTPLMRAAARGVVAEVKTLLDKGADPNYPHSTTRVTALMVAAYFGRVEVVKVLLGGGAKMELKDSAGAAAADWAAQNGHAALEQLLTGPAVSLNPFLNTGTMAFWLMDKAAGK